MDDLDHRLIGLLRGNARLPVATLAQRLGVSRGTVQNRIDKLVASGEILGFSVRLKSEDGPQGVRAVTLISEQTKNVKTVVQALRQIPEARAIHTTDGRWDVVVEMLASDLAALDRALSHVRRIEGVTATETLILLTGYKE